MCQEIEDLDVARIEALNKIREGKEVVARAYNKKVKLKFQRRRVSLENNHPFRNTS